MTSRISIFLLTFITYAVVHMMRTTYSFNKHTIQKIFGISDLFIGFVDSFIYLTLAIGTFFRYSFINSHKPVKACLVTAIPTAIGFSIVPIITLFHGQEVIEDKNLSYAIQVLMILGFGIFGFFQLTFFPSTLTLFGQSFSLKDDGRLVGIWSSKSNFGNIMGFFIANFMVYNLEIKWQYTMLLCSVSLIVACTLMYKLVGNPDFRNQPKISTKQFFKYFKKTWRSSEFKLYILSFSFFKAVLYSYELWTPKFLSDTGYRNFSGYVPMIFDVSTLFGSFLMGHIYKKQSNIVDGVKSRQIQLLNRYKFFIPSILVVAICFCYVLVPGSLPIYFAFGAIMGLFLGAIYNSLENNEILNYTGNDSAQTDMFSTINIGIGCSMVGLSQFFIGFALHLGETEGQKKDDNDLIKKGLIYLVIAGIAVAASLITLARACHHRNIDKNPSLVDTQDTSEKSNAKSLLSDEIIYESPRTKKI